MLSSASECLRVPLIVLDCGRDLHQGEFKSILKILPVLSEIVGRSSSSDSATIHTALHTKPKVRSTVHARLAHKHPTARPIERHVERGVESKLLADECIRDCAEVQNLTLAIAQCLNDAKKADPTSNRPPAFWIRRARNYLERYAVIIIFAAYCLAEAENAFSTPMIASECLRVPLMASDGLAHQVRLSTSGCAATGRCAAC